MVIRLIANSPLVFVVVLATAPAVAAEVAPLVKSLRSVGAHGKGHREAASAWKQLASAGVEQIPEILAGMQGADLLAQNWIRSAVETIAQRQAQAGGPLPVAALEKFLSDTSQAPRARRLAYELISKVDDTAESRLIPRLTNDPSLELRRDAIAWKLKEAASMDPATHKPEVLAEYRQILTAARDLDQVTEAKSKLEELGETVDLPRHFGFVLSWKLIGPFDNSGKNGFDVPYPPEKEIDLAQEYSGKGDEPIRWFSHQSADKTGMGMVDLNKAIGKHMGAIGYAFSEFMTEQERDVELRLGCINANKIWLNGELLAANHVYHTGQQLDQYVGRGKIKPGRNTILLKIAQNEQTEEWAQNWQFQLRVCDGIGTAVLSLDRPPPSSASASR